MTLLEDISKSIEEGKIRRTKELVKLAVEGGTNPRTVLTDGLFTQISPSTILTSHPGTTLPTDSGCGLNLTPVQIRGEHSVIP